MTHKMQRRPPEDRLSYAACEIEAPSTQNRLRLPANNSSVGLERQRAQPEKRWKCRHPQGRRWARSSRSDQPGLAQRSTAVDLLLKEAQQDFALAGLARRLTGRASARPSCTTRPWSIAAPDRRDDPAGAGFGGANSAGQTRLRTARCWSISGRLAPSGISYFAICWRPS